MAERVLTQRELNRALLARQMLLQRESVSVPRAVERLCALQAQYSPSPYVALWSRVQDFRKEQLTRALERRQVVKASLMRVTLHLVSANDFPYFAAAWLPGARAGIPRMPQERAEELARIVGDAANERPRTHDELLELVDGALDPYRWRIRTLAPLVHVPPSGTWRYHGKAKLTGVESWLGTSLPDQREGATRLVQRYLAAFGPASKTDLIRFAGVRVGDVARGVDALEPLRRFRNENGKELLDLPRAPLPPAQTPAPVRFLARWDALLLSHDDRARVLRPEHYDRLYGKNADVRAAFLVDGMTAGQWDVERTKDKATLVVTAFGPLPRAAREELREEGERLVRWIEDDAAGYAVRFAR